MAIEAVWGRAEILVLASTPGRMVTPHTWGREPLIGMVVGRRTWHVCQIKGDIVYTKNILNTITGTKK